MKTQVSSPFNSVWVYALMASLSSPSMPSILEIASMNLAAAKCEADVPCSLKTAENPLSSVTLFPWNTTLPLYVHRLLSSSLCLTWQSG